MDLKRCTQLAEKGGKTLTNLAVQNIEAWILIPILFKYETGTVFQLLLASVFVLLMLVPICILEFAAFMALFVGISDELIAYFKTLHNSSLWEYMFIIFIFSILMSILLFAEKLVIVRPLKAIFRVHRESSVNEDAKKETPRKSKDKAETKSDSYALSALDRNKESASTEHTSDKNKAGTAEDAAEHKKSHCSRDGHSAVAIYTTGRAHIINMPEIAINVESRYLNPGLHVADSLQDVDIDRNSVEKLYENPKLYLLKGSSERNPADYGETAGCLKIASRGTRLILDAAVFVSKLCISGLLLANVYYQYTDKNLLLGVSVFSALIFIMIINTTLQSVYAPLKNYTHSFTILIIIAIYYTVLETPESTQGIDICSVESPPFNGTAKAICRYLQLIPSADNIMRFIK
ncbi:hypothetical protein NEMIN01_1211 [Nematocida minor]|uniref:uncharacterized protein n=1 Tax=Nematocida minor TaxID=1912983 RepID=UPI00221E649B|nr:uncharacterized protein NEMIN01_1211 [Nematocida minor]KAI5190809.1 hypothetical protein NEMIN01_1211 [Nematocida minor]